MSSEYFPEMLGYFISKSRRRTANPNESSQGNMRDKVCAWILEICEESKYRMETFQLSIEIFSSFLSLTNATINTLQLIGIVSLMLAVKYHEKTTLTISEASAYCSGKVSLAAIQTTENYILQKLDWRVDIPTAAEISRLLLLSTGISYDLSKIFDRSDGFALICYLDVNLSKFSSLEIAITSTVCALEQFNQLVFRNQWVNLLGEKIEMDFTRLDQCKRGLVEMLILNTPATDRGKIECLMQDGISSLITNKLI